MTKVKKALIHSVPHVVRMAIGATLFYGSFHVGEASWIGGAMHLIGCAFFCTGVHGIHDVKRDEAHHS